MTQAEMEELSSKIAARGVNHARCALDLKPGESAAKEIELAHRYLAVAFALTRVSIK